MMSALRGEPLSIKQFREADDDEKGEILAELRSRCTLTEGTIEDLLDDPSAFFHVFAVLLRSPNDLLVSLLLDFLRASLPVLRSFVQQFIAVVMPGVVLRLEHQDCSVLAQDLLRSVAKQPDCTVSVLAVLSQHGLEHTNLEMRLQCTLLIPKLLSDGDDHWNSEAFQTAIEGLLTRTLDADSMVADKAVDALNAVRRSFPDQFRQAARRLAPVHANLLCKTLDATLVSSIMSMDEQAAAAAPARTIDASVAAEVVGGEAVDGAVDGDAAQKGDGTEPMAPTPLAISPAHAGPDDMHTFPEGGVEGQLRVGSVHGGNYHPASTSPLQDVRQRSTTFGALDSAPAGEGHVGYSPTAGDGQDAIPLLHSPPPRSHTASGRDVLLSGPATTENRASGASSAAAGYMFDRSKLNSIKKKRQHSRASSRNSTPRGITPLSARGVGGVSGSFDEEEESGDGGNPKNGTPASDLGGGELTVEPGLMPEHDPKSHGPANAQAQAHARGRGEARRHTHALDALDATTVGGSSNSGMSPPRSHDQRRGATRRHGNGGGHVVAMMSPHDEGAGMAHQSLKAEAFDYLETDDLRPSPNPGAELQDTLVALKDESWPQIFHTLNSVRRLALHHSRHVEPHVHDILRDILKQVDNLRSAVAKNAILTIADMATGLKRLLDPELALIAPVLVKRYADSSGFLSEVAEAAVEAVLQNCSDLRVISAFMSCADSRNSAIRAKTSAVLLRLVTQADARVSTFRDLDKLLTVVGSLAQDRDQDARSYARTLLLHLLNSSLVTRDRLEQFVSSYDMERIIRRQQVAGSPASHTGQTQSTASGTFARRSPRAGRFGAGGVGGRQRTSSSPNVSIGRGGERSGRQMMLVSGQSIEDGDGAGEPGAAAAHARARKPMPSPLRAGTSNTDSDGNGSGLDGRLRSKSAGAASARVPGQLNTPPRQKRVPKNRSPLAATAHIPELDVLPDLERRMLSNDWRERMQAVDELGDLIERFCRPLVAKSKLASALDQIVERFEDGNFKVAVRALEVFERLCPTVGTDLRAVNTTAVPALCAAAANTNSKVTITAERVGNTMLGIMPSQKSAHPLAIVCEHGTPKARMFAFRKLSDVLPRLAEEKPALLTRLVLPTIGRAVVESRAEVREAAVDTLRVLSGLIPEFESAVESTCSTDADAILRALR